MGEPNQDSSTYNRTDDEKIGQILLREKIVDSKDLAYALSQQKALNAKGGRSFKLGEILLFMKKINLSQLQSALLLQRNKAEASRKAVIRMKEKHQEQLEEAKRWSESFSKVKRDPTKNHEENGFVSSIKRFFGSS